MRPCQVAHPAWFVADRTWRAASVLAPGTVRFEIVYLKMSANLPLQKFMEVLHACFQGQLIGPGII